MEDFAWVVEGPCLLTPNVHYTSPFENADIVKHPNILEESTVHWLEKTCSVCITLESFEVLMSINLTKAEWNHLPKWLSPGDSRMQQQKSVEGRDCHETGRKLRERKHYFAFCSTVCERIYVPIQTVYRFPTFKGMVDLSMCTVCSITQTKDKLLGCLINSEVERKRSAKTHLSRLHAGM